jgi:hypothetical protein
MGSMRDRRLSHKELVDRGVGVVEELGRDDPLWPGHLATSVALLLSLALRMTLMIGPGCH